MPASASLLFTNARVITVNPAQPRAEALAVSGNQILFVGSNQDAQEFLGPTTRVIDCQANTLLPGFIDSHYHLWVGSAELEAANLDQVHTLEDLSQALREYAQNHPQAAWVNGSHLSYDLLPGGERITRQHLDAILPDRPVALMSYDYHTVWTNTRGLELAGLLLVGETRLTDPAMLGIDGLPNGELREPPVYGHVLKHTGAWGRASSALIYQPLPPQDQKALDEDRTLLHNGLALAARYGITSLHNMDGSYRHLAFFSTLEDLGELTCRVYVSLNVSPSTPPEDF